jgi:hypothetical protein
VRRRVEQLDEAEYPGLSSFLKGHGLPGATIPPKKETADSDKEKTPIRRSLATGTVIAHGNKLRLK